MTMYLIFWNNFVKLLSVMNWLLLIELDKVEKEKYELSGSNFYLKLCRHDIQASILP